MERRVPQPVHEYMYMKGSLPVPGKRDSDEEVPVEVWRLMQNAEWVCTVVEDYQPSEPGLLTLKVVYK